MATNNSISPRGFSIILIINHIDLNFRPFYSPSFFFVASSRGSPYLLKMGKTKYYHIELSNVFPFDRSVFRLAGAVFENTTNDFKSSRFFQHQSHYVGSDL